VDGLDFESWQAQETFFFNELSRPPLGPTQLLILCVLGLFQGGNASRCVTWCLTLSQERRLRVFENRVLRRIFGPKRDEVTEE